MTLVAGTALSATVATGELLHARPDRSLTRRVRRARGPIRSIATLVGLACTLTACGGSAVGGTPAPASPAPSSSAAQSATPLAGLSPCATLDKAIAGQGFPPATPSVADPEHACGTKKAGYGSIGVNLQDGQSYNTNFGDPDQIQEGTIRKRRAILEMATDHTSGSCAVSMEVRPHSRAMVFVGLSAGTTDQACTDTKTLAPRGRPATSHTGLKTIGLPRSRPRDGNLGCRTVGGWCTALAWSITYA
ncbi:MAG TPA: hypothetical protein VG674_07845 [Amycolatopsis sp.]|nr:hypothetical protein [Amycolatopsis sp.]